MSDIRYATLYIGMLDELEPKILKQLRKLNLGQNGYMRNIIDRVLNRTHYRTHQAFYWMNRGQVVSWAILDLYDYETNFFTKMGWRGRGLAMESLRYMVREHPDVPVSKYVFHNDRMHKFVAKMTMKAMLSKHIK